jgi:hypothetical protein
LCAYLISTIRSTCPADLILLHLITLIISGELYKLWNYSLCSLLQLPPPPSSLLDVNLLFSTLFSTPSIQVFPLVWETKFHTHTRQQVKLWFFTISSLCFYRGGRKTYFEEKGSKHSPNLMGS